MGIKVNLKNVRVGFLNVFERSEDSKGDDGNTIKGKFQTTIFMDPDDPQLGKMEAAVFEELAEKMKSEKAAEKWMDRNYGAGNHSDKSAVRDRAERDKLLEGLEEGIYIRATSHKRPKIQTSTGEDQIERGLTLDGDDIEGKEVYSGCVANVSVEFYWYEKYKVLMCTLLGIRFRADGEAFGGAGETATDNDLEDDDKPSRRRGSDAAKKPEGSRRRRTEDPDDDEDDKPSRRRRTEEPDDDEPTPRRRRNRD